MGVRGSIAQLGLSMSRRGVFLLVVAVLVGAARPGSAQRFLPDDPLWTDPDRLDMPFPEVRPVDRRIGPYEFLRRTFGVPGEYSEPARNVNTLEEVPNSSWYTNRHYRFPMSEEELRRGPNTEAGPSMQEPWKVVRFINPGELPRARIRDGTGREFDILLDARDSPEMATGAAMISSRLLHALGYNVPQHWLRRVDGDRLAPVPDSGVTQTDIDSLLSRAHPRPDSPYRVLVTRIPGVVQRLGPFRFRGTRSDDGNDVFPHELRRELRGLRIIAAWIQHTRIQRRHTLDVGVREGGRRFVRHYLTDLHLTLGSSGAAPKPSWAGHEYVLELDQIVRRIGTLGLSGGEWAETEVPRWPAVGHFTANDFDPTEWRPRWPNPAFQRCDPADAFWAAKQVRHFSKTDLQAMVATADYTSPQVEEYVLQTLLRRRNAIGRTYLHWGGGLDRFAVQTGRLTFRDLRGKYGLARDSVRRAVTWHVYDNQAERIGAELEHMTSNRESIPLPPSRAAFLRATLTTPRHGATHVFLRRTGAAGALPTKRPVGYEVVGVERSGDVPHKP